MLHSSLLYRLAMVFLIFASLWAPVLPAQAAPAADPNPLPSLTNLSPSYLYAGSATFTLTLIGSNFVDGAVSRWNGTDLATTFVSSSQLRAQVPAALVTAPGSPLVSVFNPEPGGGLSNPLTFTTRPLNTWQSAGLNGYSIYSLAADPSDPNTLYAGIGGGVMKTTNGGDSWAPAWNLPGYYVYAILVHPANSSVLFAGTSYGLYKTTSGGASWSPVTIPNFDIRAMVFDPTNPDVLYAGTYGYGMIKVSCAPVYWNYINNNMSSHVISLAIDPANPNVLYAGTNGGIAKTSNAGNYWNYLSGYYANGLAIHPTNAAMLYAATSSGIAASVNSGSSWNPIYTMWSAYALVIDPVTPTTLYAGLPTSIITSTNGGSSWDGTAGLGNMQTNVLVIPPGKPASVYAGTPYGVYRLQGSNPTPTLTSLAPENLPAGSPESTLTLNGSKFVRGATVIFGATSLPATYISPTQLQVVIPVASLASPGQVNIMVSNPVPGGGDSNSLAFALTNPTPSLSSILPTSVVVGAEEIEIILQGSGFLPTSSTQWEGEDLATTYVSSTELHAALPMGRLLAAGEFHLTVVNPGPGGGTSSAQTFTVNNPQPTLANLDPVYALLNGPEFTLSLTGENFLPGAQATWDSQALTTTYISSSRLGATIPAGLLTVEGAFPITVTNPAPSLGPSTAQIFPVYDGAAPNLTQIGPDYNFIGEPQFRLTLSGSHLLDGADLLWDGSPLAKVSASSALIPASSLNNAGTYPVSLRNPAPVDSVSNGLSFTVHPVGQWFVKGPGGSNYLLVYPGQSETLFLASGTKILQSLDRGSHWQEKSSGLPDSTAFSISYAKDGATYPSALYASTAGGVFKSTDLGENWVSASTGLTALSVRYVAVHPDNSLHLVAAVYNGGVYRSLDGGDSWSLISTPEMSKAVTVGIDPLHPDNLYVGTFDAKVFKSQDGGMIWTQIRSSCNSYSLAISPHTPGEVLVGSACGALLSLDGGATWAPKTTGISDSVVFDPVQPGVMYAAQRTGKIWRSNNHGATWKLINSGLNSAEVVTSLAVNPDSPSVLYLSGNLTTYAMKLPTPQASLNSISPSLGILGEADLVLEVNGEGFTPQAVARVTWPDTTWLDLTTTYLNPTQLSAVVPLSILTRGGTLSVSVIFPNPGSGVSNNLAFTAWYPVPSLASLNPETILAGSPETQVILTGTGWMPGAVASWGSDSLVSAYLSPTQMRVTLPASLLITPGSYPITVTNPSPNGGASLPFSFTVNYHQIFLAQVIRH